MLIKKNSAKHKPILNFLSEILKNEGSEEYKQNIIDTVDICI